MTTSPRRLEANLRLSSLRLVPWIAVIAFGWCLAPYLSAAPPAKRDSSSQGLSRLGKFFFGSSQKTRQATPDRRYYHRSSATIYSQSAAIPQTATATTAATISPGAQPLPNQPAPSIRELAGSDLRSRLSIPVSPTGPVTVETQTNATTSAGSNATLLPPRVPSANVANVAPVPKVFPPAPDYPDYATRVLGRSGFVRPPGATSESYVIDVRNMAPGEKARDPQTGLVFLVPPY